MQKKIVIVATFIFLILIASYTQFNEFSNKNAVFSTNYSQGDFFSANVSEIYAHYLSKGYSFYVDDLEFLTKLNAKKVYSSSVEKIENTYYYTNKIKKYQIINGQKVNVHIAKTNEKTLVGIPLIYYGY